MHPYLEKIKNTFKDPQNIILGIIFLVAIIVLRLFYNRFEFKIKSSDLKT